MLDPSIIAPCVGPDAPCVPDSTDRAANPREALLGIYVFRQRRFR